MTFLASFVVNASLLYVCVYVCPSVRPSLSLSLSVCVCACVFTIHTEVTHNSPIIIIQYWYLSLRTITLTFDLHITMSISSITRRISISDHVTVTCLPRSRKRKQWPKAKVNSPVLSNSHVCTVHNSLLRIQTHRQ